MILLLISLEGTDPLFSIRIQGLIFSFYYSVFSGYRTNRATSLKLCFGSGFYVDPFWWIHPFDVVILAPRIFYARILTLTQIIFLCGVTIGVLDPDWIFILPSGRRHRFSTHAFPTFLFGVGIREIFFLCILKAFFFFFLDPRLFTWIRSFFNN